MDENEVVNKSIKKKYFGVPLIKLSEPETKSELGDSMDLLDNNMSKMDSPQEEKSADNDTSYITQTTFETNSLMMHETG